MRNESLHAYSLHQRSFQEKRAIYYVLTKEYGIMHGIAAKGVPQFVPLTLFATGKKELKNFQQMTIADTVPNLIGQQQYAALYLNEITLKLLPLEDSVPLIFSHYANVISQLQYPLSYAHLKLVLRIYEQSLLTELGAAIDLEQDNEQNLIQPDKYYRFTVDNGWVLVITENGSITYSKQASNSLQGDAIFLGQDIISLKSGIHLENLDIWSTIHRQIIDNLFDYQPLQSRILWQQFMRYQ